MFHIIGVTALVSIIVSSYWLGAIFGMPFGVVEAPEVKVSSAVEVEPELVKVYLDKNITVSHQQNGEVQCDSSVGTVKLVGKIQGVDWFTTRGNYVVDGSIDPTLPLFSHMWSSRPNLDTTTICLGLGQYK